MTSIWAQPDAAAYSSRDRIAKQLEIEAIAKYVKDGMSVLDVGCGDGETVIELANRFAIGILGTDSSQQMIAVAQEKASRSLMGVSFMRHDCLEELPEQMTPGGRGKRVFDLAYSERCLINLPDWETQKKAIGNIAKALKPGGLYVMCECSWEGLQFINDLREKVGLSRLEPPGHNRYLRDVEIGDMGRQHDMDAINHLRQYQGKTKIEWPWGLRLESIDDYSGTYYYLSRVINAAMADQGGFLPQYDSPINKLALSLPPIAGLRGQGRIWLWRKA